jgi:hypothetical protein
VALSIRKMLALTLPTSGGRSVGIIRWRTQATEFYEDNTQNVALPYSQDKQGGETYFRAGNISPRLFSSLHMLKPGSVLGRIIYSLW